MPSFSRIGTSSSIERNQAASQASVKAPAQQVKCARHVRRRPAAELGVHRVAAHLDRDLDRRLPVPHRGLPLGLDRAGPAVHRQQRGELTPAPSAPRLNALIRSG